LLPDWVRSKGCHDMVALEVGASFWKNVIQ